MILGFDHDDSSIFDAQREFARDARIGHIMLGMLHAIPKTPLYDRLAAEGRLDLADRPAYGTNVIPRLLSPKALQDGYVSVFKDLYEPEAFFQRLEDLYLRENVPFCPGRDEYWRTRPWQRLKNFVVDTVRSAALYLRLTTCSAETPVIC